MIYCAENKKNIGDGMDKVIARLAEENDSLKDQLHKEDGKIKELRQKARDWERAADGLARWIEEIKEKEGAGNV